MESQVVYLVVLGERMEVFLAQGMLAVGMVGVGLIVWVFLKVFVILGMLGRVGMLEFEPEGVCTMVVGMVLVWLVDCSE